MKWCVWQYFTWVAEHCNYLSKQQGGGGGGGGGGGEAQANMEEIDRERLP